MIHLMNDISFGVFETYTIIMLYLICSGYTDVPL